MVQTKCKLNNAELFVKLFYIQSKETGNKKYYEGNKENLKNWVRVRLNIYVRKVSLASDEYLPCRFAVNSCLLFRARWMVDSQRGT